MGDHERRQTHHVFFLHKGVKFHDGVAFTCADAQYNMDELAEPYGLPVGAFQRYPQLGADMKQREAEAKYLLAEAGYAKGLEVKLMLRRGPLYKRGALSRQDDLKKVGINLKLALLDTAAINDRRRKSDFQAYTAPASVHMDEPYLYYARFTCDASSNYGKYCNPECDKLFEE